MTRDGVRTAVERRRHAAPTTVAYAVYAVSPVEQRLATATALPVASPTGNGGAAAEVVSVVVGKVTPVRYEHSHQDGSGQEENGAHVRALS
jgi:hypothetical protein